MTTDTSEKDLVAARRLWVINRRAPGLTAWQQHLQHRTSRHDIVDPRLRCRTQNCCTARRRLKLQRNFCSIARCEISARTGDGFPLCPGLKAMDSLDTATDAATSRAQKTAMWRIRYPDGRLSDMVNLTRAKDAASLIVLSRLNAEQRAA